MLLVEMWGSKKSLSRVAGQPAGEIRFLPARVPLQEGGLTNSIRACRESESMIWDSNLVAIFLERPRKLIRIFFLNDSVQDWFASQRSFANLLLNKNYGFLIRDSRIRNFWFATSLNPNFDILHLKKNSEMCASTPAETEHFQNKAWQSTFSYFSLFCISLRMFVIFFYIYYRKIFLE